MRGEVQAESSSPFAIFVLVDRYEVLSPAHCIPFAVMLNFVNFFSNKKRWTYKKKNKGLTTLLTLHYFIHTDEFIGRKDFVFLPALFLPTQASTFQFCFEIVYFLKVKAKLKRACPHRSKEKSNDLTLSFQQKI